MNLLPQHSQTQAHDICRVSSPEEREARGRTFATAFVSVWTTGATKFLRERESELRQIRQDFDDKPKTELICGVRTFTEYCENVMGYGIRQAQRVLEGKNPSLTDEENKLALDRKAKRELTASVNRNQNALPIRKKTNAEVLAETHAEKVEENKVAVLQKRVAVLTTKLQATSTKASPVSESQEKDITKIHAAEMKRFEAEIKTMQASVAKLTKAYEALRKDALRIATAGTQVFTSKRIEMIQRVHDQSQKFLQKHGEPVGGAL